MKIPTEYCDKNVTLSQMKVVTKTLKKSSCEHKSCHYKTEDNKTGIAENTL